MVDSQPPLPLKSSDKIVGGVLVAAVVGALGYGLFVLLPFLIALAANTILFGVELVAILMIAMVFLDKNTWVTIFYKWKSVSRNLRKMIVREDPIGVLDTVIHRFQAKLDGIDTNITQAAAAAARQKGAIDKAKKSAQSELDLAAAARRLRHPEAEVAQRATAAKRWAQAAADMQPMQDTLMRVQTCLERARDLCASRLDDSRNQKSVLAVKLEALQEGQQAVRSFKRFFGTNVDLDMQELAVDEIERQSTEAEAEIDQFMRTVNPILEGADLKKSADAIQAMDRFSAYLGDAPAVKVLPMPAKDGVVAK